MGSETDLEAIDRVRETHVAALNASDAEAWAAQFTDDGVQMPQRARKCRQDDDRIVVTGFPRSVSLAVLSCSR